MSEDKKFELITGLFDKPEPPPAYTPPDWHAIIQAGVDGTIELEPTQIVYVMITDDGDCAVGYYANDEMPPAALLALAAMAIQKSA